MEDALKQIEDEAVQEVDEDEILTYMIEQKQTSAKNFEESKDPTKTVAGSNTEYGGNMLDIPGSSFIGPNDSIS